MNLNLSQFSYQLGNEHKPEQVSKKFLKLGL